MQPERSAKIGIIELGRVGIVTLRSLLELGWRNFVLGDARLVSLTDTIGDSTYRHSDLGQRRVDAATRVLGLQFPESLFEMRAGPEGGPLWSAGWLEHCAVCLLACDAPTELVAFEVNTTCLRARIPLIPGLAMGSAGQVGPIVELGEGPCLRCIDLRIRAATGRPSLTPELFADESIVERVGLALAERTRYFIDECTGIDIDKVEYFWSGNETTTYSFLSTAMCADCLRLLPPMPYCAPTLFKYRDRCPSNPHAILGMANRLVNPIAGPIRSLQRFEPTWRAPAVKHWVAELADPSWQSFGRASLNCGGSALEDDEARAAALGEAVERACVCPPPYGQLPIARYCDVVDDALDPLLWNLYHEETRKRPGFPYVKPSRTLPTTWAWGYSLNQGRPVMVPASRVFSPLRPTAPGDYTDSPIISGFATGNTLEEATLAGLLETLERDAFMIAWANKLPLTLLRLSASSPDQVGEYYKAFCAAGIEVRCFSLLLDLAAILVVAIARSDCADEPASVVAAAADLDCAAACRRALKELSANRLTVQYEMLKAGGLLPTPDPNQVVDETAHGLLYARRDMIPMLDFWWEASESIDLPTAQPPEPVYARLRRIVERVGHAGLEVIAIDLTPPEFRSMDLWIIKTIVPGAYPMNFDERWRQLGGARMACAPVAAGLRQSATEFRELNRLPHPFP